ncbi:RNA-binding domain-containing protein [Choiromyces venosus 120613-1]|uniref:RNA-binding domain-containing protein n=1 Tax=Choiromyces venosus 120613-1 TaxID=1336337 RepID=A0A3N4K4W6_9PEZI|nr:RNA-binding domain-containing protein [Choiromyces venosus 120613-1]
MDTDHGTCKGYGFARYENVDEAEDCIRGLVSSKYEAGFARESFNARLKTLADPNSTNVYVSNLPRSMNEKTMQDIFSGYTVVSNRILRDPEGNSRGVGFARFEDRSICDEIIRNFHGKLVGEEQIPLQVRYADTSAQKRLKATTTKKRQFRSNEYNSVVNSCYPSIPHHNVQPNNRVWPTSGPGNTLTFPVIPQSGSGKPEDWETPHWRPSTAIDQLETVRENGDDGDSESKTETNETNSPIVFDSITGSLGKTSSGSFSDPGDSYGGLEVSHGTHSF